MKLENMSYNIQKVKDNDFGWFKAVIAGWVDAGTLEKCSLSAITKKWESLTGLKLKNK